MRRPTAIGMFLVTIGSAGLVAIQPPAHAHHRPHVYCSESGDLCQATRREDGRRKFGILLAARYFTRFHICVTDPDGFESCVPFRIRAYDNGNFGRVVTRRKYFPYGGKGAYTVRWVVEGDRIGKVLGFHVN